MIDRAALDALVPVDRMRPRSLPASGGDSSVSGVPVNVAPATSRAKGMRDMLPDEMERARRVESAFIDACRAWGYSEVRTPAIEPLYLFTSAGTLSPQALDRVYSFLDWDGWSGERVVLRPDSTIAAARLYAERLQGHTAKLFYSQDVFRFTEGDEPRQEWQCGVELIGDTGAEGDIEVIMLALDALARLGIDRPTVRVSHAGVVRAVLGAAGLSPDEQGSAYDRLLDGDLAVVAEIESRLPQLNAPLHLLFDVQGAGSGYISNIDAVIGDAIPDLRAALAELAPVVEALESAGIPPVIETVLARSFEYYSGLVFRIDVEGRRVGAGGRYDDLVALVGGARVPASGFALYLSAISALVPLSTKSPSAVAVRADAPSFARETAARLRAAGVPASTVADEDAGTVVVADSDAAFSLERDGETTPALTFEQLVSMLESAT